VGVAGVSGAPPWLPFPYLVATLLLAWVTTVAWRGRRGNVNALGVAVSTGGGALWAAADVVAATMATGRLTLRAFPVLMSLTLFGITFIISGLWIVGEGLRDPGWRPGRRPFAVTTALATATLLTGLSSPWTRIVTARVHDVVPGRWWVIWTPGWGYWTIAVVDFAATAWVLARLARHTREGLLRRRQATTVFAAALISAAPSVAIGSIAAGRIPDLSPLMFPFSALVYLYAAFRQGLFRLVPIARGFVLDRLSDAVLVVDRQGRYLDGNPAGRRLVRARVPDTPESLAGLQIGVGLERLGNLPAGSQSALDLPTGPVVLDVRMDDLYDRRGNTLARAFVLRDVTELHLERENLATVNLQLHEQLDIVERLRERLTELALRDEGTGLHNRRYLLAQLDDEIRRALGGHRTLWVLLLDVDRFKTVNDEHGHAVGDRLLSAIGQALSRVLPEHDHILARYGGEEFVIVLPGLRLEQVTALAERCRSDCAAVQVSGPGGPVSRTISVGVTDLDSAVRAHGVAGVTAARLLEAADEALYAAKAAGRDRVVVTPT
jgi:diguanylate cyclase (GGDEF)-like protein